jgi:pimeloyl-ACP methyl ester carboxylesterase
MSSLHLPSSLEHVAPVFPSLVLGGPNSPSLLVLLSGFPDDCRSAWGPTSPQTATGATSRADGASAASTSGSGDISVLDELARSHRIFSLCLPGFDDDGARRFDRWGYDFPALVRGMHATIEALLREESVARATFTLVCHDWGAAVGQLYENAHPERVAKLVPIH